jgi:hypothetical protein
MRRKRSETHPAASAPRAATRIHQERAGKLPDLAHCPQCEATYRNGRWTWDAAEEGSYPHVCPACERIAADFPAGEVQIEGGFATAHRDELIGLIRNIESRERDAHPLKRIMRIDEGLESFRVTTTDAKLADAIGRALQHAYKGELDLPPTTSDRENLVRIHWKRD